MDNQPIDDAFSLFSNLLEERFKKSVYTTEDSVRYTLFHCLTRYLDLNPSDIILEQAHPLIPRAEVDMHILAGNGVPEMYFEFKYDRVGPCEKNAPRPQKAGKVFADIFRLALISSDSKRYFVYITDGEMAAYFMNTQNRLSDFFNLRLNDHLMVNSDYVENHCDTFVKSSGNNVESCKIKCTLGKKVREDIWVRIYEII